MKEPCPAKGERGSLLAIAKSAGLIALLTAAVKLVAMVKEMALASHFGLRPEMDAYNLGTAVTAFAGGILLGGYAPALVPAYIHAKREGGTARATRLSLGLGLILLVALLFVVLLLSAVAGPLVTLIAPKASPSMATLLRMVIWGTLPMLLFQGVTGTMGGSLNAEGRFVATTLAPVLTSLALLLGVLTFGERFSLSIMIFLILAGAGGEAAVVAAAFRLRGPWPPLRAVLPSWEEISSFCGQYFPMLFGYIFLGSTMVVDMSIASRLGAGEVAAIGYAIRLPSVIITLASGALSTAALPTLSQLAAQGNNRELKNTLSKAVLILLCLTTVGTIGLCFFSETLVRLLYHRGAFGPEEVSRVATIQTMYFLQTPFYVTGVFLARFIMALRRNRIIFFGTVLNAGANVIFDVILAPRLGSAGIALSTSLVYLVACAFLGFNAWRLFRELPTEAIE